MVRVHVKHGDREEERDSLKEFIYDCQSNSTIEEIAQEITEIANLQSQILHLATQLERPLSLYAHPQVKPLMRAVSEAKSYASNNQVLHNKPLSVFVLKDQLQGIQKELVLYYHIIGLPDSNFRKLLTDLKLLEEDKTQLWWAGKEIVRGNRLCQYIGNNEKTKIKLMLDSPSSSYACNSQQVNLNNKMQPRDSGNALQ